MLSDSYSIFPSPICKFLCIHIQRLVQSSDTADFFSTHDSQQYSYLHSILFTAQLLQLSVLLSMAHTFPSQYVPSSSNLRLFFTVVIFTAAHSRWVFATQTKWFLHLLLRFSILPSASSALLLIFTQISSLLDISFTDNIEMTTVSQFWPFLWKTSCV